jgi:hypothetical protein
MRTFFTSSRASFFLLALTAGCATGLPRCPEKGGPAWRAVETEHFVVYTDATSTRAAEVAADLEYVRKALVQFLLPGGAGPAGQIPVVLMTGHGHFDEFFPKTVHGWYGDLFYQPTIMLADRQSLSAATIIKHELTHFIVDGVVPGDYLPRWVSEGLASYTETMLIDRDRQRVTFGETTDERAAFALARYDPAKIAHYFDVDKMTKGAGAFYGQSWLKIHYLVTHERRLLAVFLRRLREGRGEEAAWSEAFPYMPPSVFEKKLEEYARYGRYTPVTMDVTPDETRATERPMADADVHAWRAVSYGVRYRMKRGADAEAAALARAEIAEARRQDPGSALACLAEATLGAAPSVEHGKEVTARHPDSWLGWLMLAMAHEAAGNTLAGTLAMAEALRLSRANPAIRLAGVADGKRQRRARHDPLDDEVPPAGRPPAR